MHSISHSHYPPMIRGIVYRSCSRRSYCRTRSSCGKKIKKHLTIRIEWDIKG
jgi:hypothetical protein